MLWVENSTQTFKLILSKFQLEYEQITITHKNLKTTNFTYDYNKYCFQTKKKKVVIQQIQTDSKIEHVNIDNIYRVIRVLFFETSWQYNHIF